LKTVSRRTQFSSSALPPAGTLEAIPRYISRKTSYHRVRLEFLSYPQVISACCTVREFGPPPDFRLGSSCPWIAHPVSGYVHDTKRPLRLAFAAPTPHKGLSLHHTAHSQAHSSIGTRSPLRASALCRHTVSDTISSPSPGCFSPFPRGTCPLSITKSI
jgi:hypothetical protein